MIAALPTARVWIEISPVVSGIFAKAPLLSYCGARVTTCAMLPNIFGHFQLRAVVDVFELDLVHQRLDQFHAPTPTALSVLLIGAPALDILARQIRLQHAKTLN